MDKLLADREEYRHLHFFPKKCIFIQQTPAHYICTDLDSNRGSKRENTSHLSS